MFSVTQAFQEIIAENSVRDAATALVVAGVALLLLYAIRRFAVARLVTLAQRTANQIDDILADALVRTKFMFLLAVAIWSGSKMLALPPPVSSFIGGLVLVVLLLQVGFWANTIIGFVIGHFVRLEVEDEASQVATGTALTFVGRLFLWSLLFLLALDNLGVDVNALIASLGIGGIAIALAAQNILGDLFGSLSIMFDKPFVVGDFIIVDDLLGSVEKIGLKSTRVRSLSGEQLIFSNNDLLNSRVRNFKRMLERRITFSVGVTYQTPADKLEKIPGIVKGLIEKEERARFDRCHFLGFDDSSLRFDIVYWVKLPDFNVYADIQHELNIAIYRRFEEEGIEFAYPTRTLWVAHEGPAPVQEEHPDVSRPTGPEGVKR
jgi:small-conductance mechanosensitive channel